MIEAHVANVYCVYCRILMLPLKTFIYLTFLLHLYLTNLNKQLTIIYTISINTRTLGSRNG